jgi:hypothetical protein
MILQDLISRIRQTTWNEVEVFLEVPVTCRPFMESFNNNLTGWSAEIVLEVKNPFNNCDAAFTS